MRDDFTEAIKKKLAARAGYRCSVPDCRRPTHGASLGNEEGFTNIGIAAHITAASPGGPRYDGALKPEDRTSILNGIWCCANHAKQIDSDAVQFPLERLREWKHRAELASHQALLTGERPAATLETDLLDTAAVEQVRRLKLPAADDLPTVTERLRAMGRQDLLNLRRGLKVPDHAFELTLHISDPQASTNFEVAGLASAITTFSELAVVAPPGTGKTTTLLLAAEAMLERADLVPLLVPLGEWSTQNVTLFQAVLRRQAFQGAADNHLRLLAIHGRLVLLLDGWNELDPAARRRLRDELNELRRDFAELAIVITTRRQALDLPLNSPLVEIEPLSASQQRRIAVAARGDAGRTLLEQARRTPGVRDLVAIPLYLATLLKHTAGGALPTTKEAVLRLFIEQHDHDPVKADALMAATQGFHARYLTALAAEATAVDSVSLSDEQARAVIARVSAGLVERLQIGPPAPQPNAILGALVDHHLLVRATGTAFIFQHQQFQEFYAAARVEESMRTSAAGDAAARVTLRSDILDRHSWEESILFACERLSREAGTVEAVTATIREALTIDPMLAAEMIFRSSDAVWQAVHETVEAFAARWHVAGGVDRAFRFMLITGRSEFAPMVWALITHPNDQVYMRALRAADPIRISVLGANAEDQLRQLPREVRRHVLAELVMQGGYEGMELATRMAREDEEPAVRDTVIDMLLFRGALQQAEQVLETSPVEVWQHTAARLHGDPDLAEMPSATRLMEIREAQIAGVTDLLQRLSLATRAPPPLADAEVQRLLESADLPTRDVGTDQRVRSVLYEVGSRYPAAMRAALVTRATLGLSLPYGALEYLEGDHPPIEDGPLVEVVLDPAADKHRAAVAARVVGPAAVARLIDQAIAIDQRLAELRHPDNQPVHEELRRVQSLVHATGPRSFAMAVLERAGLTDPRAMAQVAELVAHHGDGLGDRKPPLPIDEALRTRLVEVLRHFGESMLVHAEATRAQMVDVAAAISRLPAAELAGLLDRLLTEDLRRRRRALEEFHAARAAGGQVPNSDVSREFLYRRAFANLANDVVVRAMTARLPDLGRTGFGVTAAFVLLDLWLKEHRTTEEGFRGFRDQFADVEAHRAERRAAQRGAAHGDTIFQAVEMCLREATQESQIHALLLARVAVTMPYVNREALIAQLLVLPVPSSAKLEFMTALARAGETLSSELVLAGIRELIAVAAAQPWMLHDQHSRVYSWLSLLAFSDRPMAILETYEQLPPVAQDPSRWGDVLAALSFAPQDQAEGVLMALAERAPRFGNDNDWRRALERRLSPNVIGFILDGLVAGRFTRPHVDHWDLSRRLAAVMQVNQTVRELVYRRFNSTASSIEYEILRMALAEAADEEAILLLVSVAARNREVRVSGDLSRALERVAVSRRSIDGWEGAYELEGRPLTDLRRELFARVRANDDDSALASESLTIIDVLRDEHGAVLAEPRHPDIATGVPWPMVD